MRVSSRTLKSNRPRPALTPEQFQRITRPREEAVHLQLCNYIRAKYPNVIFNSDGSGWKVSKAQAGKAKMMRSSSKLPDFFMAEPRGRFAGLFLELKRDRDEIFKKSGEARSTPHLEGQADILNRLEDKGYLAEFACGLSEAIERVDYYMGLPLPIR